MSISGEHMGFYPIAELAAQCPGFIPQHRLLLKLTLKTISVQKEAERQDGARKEGAEASL